MTYCAVRHRGTLVVFEMWRLLGQCWRDV